MTGDEEFGESDAQPRLDQQVELAGICKIFALLGRIPLLRGNIGDRSVEQGNALWEWLRVS